MLDDLLERVALEQRLDDGQPMSRLAFAGRRSSTTQASPSSRQIASVPSFGSSTSRSPSRRRRTARTWRSIPAGTETGRRPSPPARRRSGGASSRVPRGGARPTRRRRADRLTMSPAPSMAATTSSRACGDDAAGDEDAARLEVSGQPRRQLDEDARRRGWPSPAGTAPPPRPASVRSLTSTRSASPFALGVGAGGFDRQRIGVVADDRLARRGGARRGPGSRSRSDVEDPVRHRFELLQQLEAARASSGAGPVPNAIPGSRITTTSSGAARTPRHDGTITIATDALRDVVRLPGIGPVRVVDRPHPERADRAQPEGLEVPERPLGRIHRRPPSGPSATCAVTTNGAVGSSRATSSSAGSRTSRVGWTAVPPQPGRGSR